MDPPVLPCFIFFVSYGYLHAVYRLRLLIFIHRKMKLIYISDLMVTLDEKSGSPKLVGFILWCPVILVDFFMAIHPTVSEITVRYLSQDRE